MKEELILEQIEAEAGTIFQDCLVGVYVHGSLAFGCFHWEKSDLDFIVVTRTVPALEQKAAFIQALLRMDKDCPPKGLEMSVVLEQHCKNFEYPTPFELHFSNCHKAECSSPQAIKGYCERMKGTDYDLAAHFTVIRETGLVLCGREIPQVFGEVPREAYLDSLQRDLRDAEKEGFANPMDYILNLCRVLAYMRKDYILSKEQGGVWGLKHLPGEYRAVIQAALDCYRSEKDGRMTESGEAFAAYMRSEIFSAPSGT